MFAIVAKTKAGHWTFRKLLGWTLDPMKAALSDVRPFIQASEPGMICKVKDWEDLANTFPAVALPAGAETKGAVLSRSETNNA